MHQGMRISKSTGDKGYITYDIRKYIFKWKSITLYIRTMHGLFTLFGFWMKLYCEGWRIVNGRKKIGKGTEGREKKEWQEKRKRKRGCGDEEANNKNNHTRTIH